MAYATIKRVGDFPPPILWSTFLKWFTVMSWRTFLEWWLTNICLHFEMVYTLIFLSISRFRLAWFRKKYQMVSVQLSISLNAHSHWQMAVTIVLPNVSLYTVNRSSFYKPDITLGLLLWRRHRIALIQWNDGMNIDYIAYMSMIRSAT